MTHKDRLFFVLIAKGMMALFGVIVKNAASHWRLGKSKEYFTSAF
tara:strand:+ start:153 stop:287 length:135 start_codon:yes stop_codon:yes gene_type:complete